MPRIGARPFYLPCFGCSRHGLLPGTRVSLAEGHAGNSRLRKFDASLIRAVPPCSAAWAPVRSAASPRRNRDTALLDQTTAREQLPGEPTTGAKSARRLVLAAVMMATFMAAMESSIVATAMPTIVAELGGFHLFSWAFAAYLLTQAVTIPIYGRLADLYGRKRVFYAGAGLFLFASALCGLAWAMLPLILFRALQGAGAGAIQPIATTIVGDIYQPTERAHVQGYISGVF